MSSQKEEMGTDIANHNCNYYIFCESGEASQRVVE